MGEYSANIGQYAWLPDDKHIWIPAKITEDNGSELKVEYQEISELDDKQNAPLKSKSISKKKFEKWGKTTAQVLSAQEDDLFRMPQISEAVVINSIRERYINDLIYTRIGQILVVCNPYKRIPCDIHQFLKAKDDAEIDSISPPHCYGTARKAALRATGQLGGEPKNQSIIISGESGAGKTETAKLCLQVLASMGGADGIENRMMSSNSIFEIFGNAKTVRNNNSSRFGKWLQLTLNPSDGRISQINILQYLLEKSRVSLVGPNERNYHVFYSLINSQSKYSEMIAQSSGINSNDPSQFRILKMGGCIQAPGIDDKEFFDEMMQSFKDLNFTMDDIDSFLTITVVCLLIGQLEWTEKDNQSGSIISELTNDSVKLINQIASLLRLDDESDHQLLSDRLKQACCNRKMIVMKKENIIPLDKEHSIVQRDSFIRDLYNQLFIHLVSSVNGKINNYDANAPLIHDDVYDSSFSSVGVLDIFGFEIFDTNLFEQFCINWANERLQNQFNNYIFKSQMNTLSDDGIDTTKFQFDINDLCLKMIENNKTGIVRMISDECTMPKGSDEGLITKIIKHNTSPKNQTRFFSKSSDNKKNKKNKKSMNDMFVIHHFADSVEYLFEGCLKTNLDKTPLIFIDLLKESKMPLIRNHLYPLEEDSQNNNKSSSKTVAEYFRNQLSSLMKTMNSTQPNYIRCLKPNTIKKPGIFIGSKTMEQLKSSGIFEVIRIRSLSYPYTLDQESFFKKYKVLLISSMMMDEEKRQEQSSSVTLPSTIKGKCEILIQHLLSLSNEPSNKHSSSSKKSQKTKKQMDTNHTCLLGNTKVFYNDDFRIPMDKLKTEKMLDSVLLIQSLCNSIYIQTNYVCLKTVKDCLKKVYFKQDIKAMKHWIFICEQLKITSPLLPTFQACIDLFKVINNKNHNNNNEQELDKAIDQCLEICPDYPLVSKAIEQYKYLPKLKQALKEYEQASHNHDNNNNDDRKSQEKFANLKRITDEVESHCPQISMLIELRTMINEKQKRDKMMKELLNDMHHILSDCILEDMQNALNLCRKEIFNETMMESDYYDNKEEFKKVMNEMKKQIKKKKNERKMMMINTPDQECLEYYLANDNKEKHRRANEDHYIHDEINFEFKTCMPFRQPESQKKKILSMNTAYTVDDVARSLHNNTKKVDKKDPRRVQLKEEVRSLKQECRELKKEYQSSKSRLQHDPTNVRFQQEVTAVKSRLKEKMQRYQMLHSQLRLFPLA